MTVRSILSLAALSVALLSGGLPAKAQGNSGAYLAAQQASGRSDYAEAARYFAEAVAADPENSVLLQNAILNMVIAGQFESAVPLSKRLSGIDADMQLAGLVLVADALKDANYTEAMTLLETDDLQSNALLTGLLKGWVSAGMGDTAAAGDHFDSLDGNTNFSALGQYHKALVLALAGNFDGAVEILNGNESGPLRVNRASVIAHAQALVQLDQTDEALKVLSDAALGRPVAELTQLSDRIKAGEVVEFDYVGNQLDGAAEVFLTLATALDQEDAGRFALLYARLAQQIRPGYVDALLLTADVFETQGQFGLSIKDYAKIPNTSPVYMSAEIGRANALASSGDAGAAIDALAALAQRFPEERVIHIALGDMLRREERYEGAAQSYTRAIDLIDEVTPREWRTFYVRGIAHERLDQWDQAEADFRRSLELSPDQPLVLNYLGYSLVEKRLKIDEAKDMIERAVAARPNDGYITDSLGWVLYRLGRFDEAVPHMERAVELLPTDPIINDHLGDVLWKVGRKTEAVFQWKRALSFDPEDVDATRIRKKLDVGLDVVLEEEGDEPIK